MSTKDNLRKARIAHQDAMKAHLKETYKGARNYVYQSARENCETSKKGYMWVILLFIVITLGLQGTLLIHTLVNWKSHYKKESSPDKLYSNIVIGLLIVTLIIFMIPDKYLELRPRQGLIFVNIVGIAFVAFVAMHWNDEFANHENPPGYYYLYSILLILGFIYIAGHIIYCLFINSYLRDVDTEEKHDGRKMKISERADTYHNPVFNHDDIETHDTHHDHSEYNRHEPEFTPHRNINKSLSNEMDLLTKYGLN